MVAAALEMGAALLALTLYCRTSQLYGGRHVGATNDDGSDGRSREHDEIEQEALEPSSDCTCHVRLIQNEDRTGHGT